MSDVQKIRDLFDASQLEEAELILSGYLAVNDGDAEAYFLSGQIYYRKQEWGKAINQFRRALEIDPEYPGAKSQIEMANAILGYFSPDMFNP